MSRQRFELVTHALTGEKQSSLHTLITQLRQNKSPIIQELQIKQSIKDGRDVFFVDQGQPETPVLTALPINAQVSCHLSFDKCFYEATAQSSKRTLSLCHYTEQYAFQPGNLWKSCYSKVTIHVYFGRDANIIHLSIKGFKPEHENAEILDFPEPLNAKITTRCERNARRCCSVIHALHHEKTTRLTQLTQTLDTLELQLSEAYKAGKRAQDFKRYMDIAPRFIATIEQLNALNDQVHDARGQPAKSSPLKNKSHL
jgi:hypothetical protein